MYLRVEPACNASFLGRALDILMNCGIWCTHLLGRRAPFPAAQSHNLRAAQHQKQRGPHEGSRGPLLRLREAVAETMDGCLRSGSLAAISKSITVSCRGAADHPNFYNL